MSLQIPAPHRKCVCQSRAVPCRRERKACWSPLVEGQVMSVLQGSPEVLLCRRVRDRGWRPRLKMGSVIWIFGLDQ